MIALFAVSAWAASVSLTQLPPTSFVTRLRMSDRVETAEILRDIFLREPGKPQASSEAVDSLVYSRFEAFSGACFQSKDSFCPDHRGFYETAGKHSVVREGYLMQACGSLAGSPENVRRALSHVSLLPTDELSARNLLKAYGLFYPGSKTKEGDLTRTIQLMAKVQRGEGAEKAWQKFLTLVCSSVGWQVY